MTQYLGFKDMYEHRHRPCSLKDKNIVQEMKKSPIDPPSAGYNREFARMEICHHCKLLHPESALVCCEYRSSRCGNPVPPSPYYDSYINQILKSNWELMIDEQNRVTAMRFLNSSSNRKNSYFHYIKKGKEILKKMTNMFVKESTADTAWKIMKSVRIKMGIFVLSAGLSATVLAAHAMTPLSDSNLCTFW